MTQELLRPPVYEEARRAFCGGRYGEFLMLLETGSLQASERESLLVLVESNWSTIPKSQKVGTPPKRVAMGYVGALKAARKLLGGG